MFTLAVAGSRERLALTAVETISRKDAPALLVVTLSARLPEAASPTEQHAAVAAMSDAVRAMNDGEEPRIVVSYGGAGTTLAELLREDRRRGRRARWPTPVASVASANDGRAIYMSPNRLAAVLFREWHEGRITFAPGLDKLRTQMAAFVPRESKAGNLTFGDESLAAYDDAVVSLMHAVAVRGYGVARFIDDRGQIWASHEEAVAYLGARA